MNHDLFSQKNKLHQLYVTQLNKTIKEYPSYKMDTENKYQEQLSILNGITKQIKQLKSLIREKTTKADQLIQNGDTELRKLKKVEHNLSNYTSYEELDITSQQLLADATQDYTEKKMVFYIKLIVVFVVCYQLYISLEDGWKETVIVGGLTLAIFIAVSLYRYFTFQG